MAEVDVYRRHVPNDEDWKYVRGLVHHAPSHVLPALFSEYCRAWKEGSESQEVRFKKDNAGRFRANSLLRRDAQAMKSGCAKTAEKYRALIAKGPKQSCHTCKHSNIYGDCAMGQGGPGNLCLEWESEV